MKKILPIILCILITSLLPVAGETKYSAPFDQKVYGYVGSIENLSVTLDESVFPFDIMSDIVALNTDTERVKGLRIGTIDMSSNNDTFTITISHDTLKHNNETPGLDYRLDVFYGPGFTDFETAFAFDGANPQDITINRDCNTTLFNASPYFITNRSIYVSMNESAETLQDNSASTTAPKGDYISTITFNLTVTE